MTNKYTLSLSRRNKYNYKYSLDDICDKYNNELRMIEHVPEVFATAMGDVIVIITVEEEKQIADVMNYVQEKI